jgi:glycosyltransferase involved in cell wall biosynthesis
VSDHQGAGEADGRAGLASGRETHSNGHAAHTDRRAASPLRIALVAPPVLPIPPQAYAGTERVVAALADELVARGHQVTLFASGDSSAGSEVVPVLERAAWSGGIAGEVAPLAMLSATLATQQAGRFDILHSHVDVAGVLMARLAPVPVLTTFHQRLDVPGAYESVHAFGDAPLVSISDSQRRWHPEANWIATIPHGLPLTDMPFSETPGDYLVVVGRAAPEKGLAEAIEVASRTGMRLRIAAKARHEPERAYLEEHVRPALGEQVEFLGEVGPDVRDPLLAGARATLMLGAWPEPFGLVAIESLATGTPVIARRAGALPEIVEHGVDGFLVDDLTEATLAVRLATGLDRRAIRERALARFSVARMVDAYERVYRDLVEAARRDGRVPAERVAEAVAVATSTDGHGPARSSAVSVQRSRIPVETSAAVARDGSSTGD